MRNHVCLCRKALGWSQETLGQLAGVSKYYIGQIERGISRPSYDTADELSDLLLVPMEVLFPTGEPIHPNVEEALVMTFLAEGLRARLSPEHQRELKRLYADIRGKKL